MAYDPINQNMAAAMPGEKFVGIQSCVSKFQALLSWKERAKALAKSITGQGGPNDLLVATQPIGKVYYVFFFGYHSKIMIHLDGSDKPLSFNFLPAEVLTSNSQQLIHNEIFVPVQGENEIVSHTVAQLSAFVAHMPGTIEVLTISGETFFGNRHLEDANIISEIGECKTLRLDGNFPMDDDCRRKMNAAFTIILNKMLVREKINTRCVSPTTDLVLENLTITPIVELNVQHVSGEDLLKFASLKGKYHVEEYSLEDLNLFIKLWLASNSMNIHRLNIKIENAEGENIHLLFKDLVHHGQLAPCCSFTSRCSVRNCNHQKQAHLKITGVDLHRKDGAVATIFYSAALHHYSFAFFVSYPGESGNDRFEKYKKMLENMHRSHRSVLAEYRKNVLQRKRLLEWIPQRLDFSSVPQTFAVHHVVYCVSQWELHDQCLLSDDAKKLEMLMWRAKEKRETFGYLALK